jgi:preprotein translocase subunit SecF
MVQWIKPGLNIDWVGHRKKFYFLSGMAALIGLGAMVFNTIYRGSPLNYGTDFAGGTEIQIEFSRAVEPAAVRSALDKAGFKNANAVRLADSKRPHFFLVRLGEVAAFSPADQAKLKSALERAFPGQLASFDYKGGSDKLYVKLKGKGVEPAVLEKAITAAGTDTQQVHRFGKAEAGVVYEVVLAGIEKDIRRRLDGILGQGSVKDIPQIQAVGPKMGAQLRTAGMKGMIYTLILIMLYVALRFDFRYAPGGVIALFHDVFITTGLLALTWTEFSMTAVAALLTLAGFSINDTIVIYDRVREDVVRYRDRNFSAIVNAAINECMSRTVLTSFSVLLSIVPIWLVGRGDLAIFGFIFTFGAFVGVYSTVAIASPLVVYFNQLATKRARRT